MKHLDSVLLLVRDQENCFISTSVFCFLDSLHGSTWVQFTEALSIPGEVFRGFCYAVA